MEELKVLYEDNHIIVVIKEQNVPTQSDVSGDCDMLTRVKAYIKEKCNKPGDVYIGLVHRLDRPTGGVMVFARTSKSASRLSDQIREGNVQKRYLAVTSSLPKKDSGRLENYLKKNASRNTVEIVPETTTDAKFASLDYSVVQKVKDYALIDVDLHTGRSHQIRVQLSAIGAPIVGDKKYNATNSSTKMALWCYKLEFEHPTTKQIMKFVVYPPEEKPWTLFKIDNLK